MSWQSLREMFDDIERPISLVRFAQDIYYETLELHERQLPKGTDLLGEIRITLDKEISGDAFVLALFIVELFKKFPAANPYNHPEED
ncbi:MAG TPA: hypothetical protein VM715_02695 [Candidatus Acidoferrum sp.]|nr:hypothetical protein [Candidatus Acidoferrum sp.]